ncbi:MAG: chorismate mutase [Dehalococcoidia bacterium]
MGGCWGIRGATTAEDNSRDSILAATKEMLQRIIDENDLDKSQVAAVWFTTTSDLNAEYPALAARQLGWMNAALLCAHEMAVPNGLPRCIRVLILVNTSKSPEDLKYVYLKEAQGLRTQGLEP